MRARSLGEIFVILALADFLPSLEKYALTFGSMTRAILCSTVEHVKVDSPFVGVRAPPLTQESSKYDTSARYAILDARSLRRQVHLQKYASQYPH